MKFRFIGKYTNGHTGISILGHHFEGREPTEVSGDVIERFLRHPEFEAEDEDAVVTQMMRVMSDAPAPKRRGRKPKAAD